jgi:hypothetical protein
MHFGTTVKGPHTRFRRYPHELTGSQIFDTLKEQTCHWRPQAFRFRRNVGNGAKFSGADINRSYERCGEGAMFGRDDDRALKYEIRGVPPTANDDAVVPLSKPPPRIVAWVVKSKLSCPTALALIL